MTATILAACSPGEVRVAVVADARLVDFALWWPGRPDGVGDLHRGRIEAVARDLAGSFVALEGESLGGFLPDSAVAGRPAEGTLLGVRVTRAAQGGKGVRLAGRLTPEEAALTAAGPVRLVRRGDDPVRRFALRYPESAIVVDDAGLAAGPLAGRGAQVVAQAFPAEIEDEVAGLAQESVALPGGGRLRIQNTAALTAIDLDSGAGGGAGAKTASHSGFNRAALPELARQIRLRNLSGAILVDPAGLSPKHRAGLGAAFQAALATDPVACRLVGFTGLGLAEILRNRVHPPLYELLGTPQAAMAAALRAAVGEVPAGVRARLLVATALIGAYDSDEWMRQGLARRVAGTVAVQADPTLAPGTWRLQTGAM